mmetsp:Transcript_77652/g.206220  ORF Transcript_77652/g.206220 Transcript_77652/m.206220 type:complete len:230 (-) Transcript_77652:84-773(-)
MSKSGVVKFFNEEKGYGFLVQDDGMPDLFAHRNDCVGNMLQEGDRVTYDEAQNDRNGKPQAKNVTGGTGGPNIGGGGGGGGRGKGGKKGRGGGGGDWGKGGKNSDASKAWGDLGEGAATNPFWQHDDRAGGGPDVEIPWDDEPRGRKGRKGKSKGGDEWYDYGPPRKGKGGGSRYEPYGGGGGKGYGGRESGGGGKWKHDLFEEVVDDFGSFRRRGGKGKSKSKGWDYW